MPNPSYPGPDAIDLQLLIRELQEESKGTVEVKLSAPQDRYSGAIYVDAQHTYPAFRGPAKPAIDTSTGQWPNAQHKNFDGYLYWCVYDLWQQYQARTEQLELPF